jgi:ribosomal protein S18 acetylase RimI-like enzyme
MNPNLYIHRVDYRAPQDGLHLRQLLDLYARDPMGGSEPLAASVLERLCDDLARRPNAASFLAYRGAEPSHPNSDPTSAPTSDPLGLINCFEGYSTFKAQPLLNVHDIVVHPKVRGQGVAQALLAAVQQLAIERGCCKLTLEVLSGNTVAMNAYDRFGFKHYQLDPDAGHAVLLQKWL